MKPHNAVILVRPKRDGSRLTKWEVVCGDCGPCGDLPAKLKAEKAANAHNKTEHQTTAVVRIRQ